MSDRILEDTPLPTEGEMAPTLAAMPIHARLINARRAENAGDFTSSDVAELIAYIAEARRLEEPASREFIERAGRSLENHYPTPCLSAEQRRDRLWDWCGDLKDVPPDVLEAAVKAWRMSGEQDYPTAGRLLLSVGGRDHWGCRRGTFLRHARAVLERIEARAKAA